MLNISKRLKKEIIANRRTLHEFAEIGFELNKTLAFIKKELNKIDIEPTLVGQAGYSFTLGNSGPTILLRADMDALPIEEKTGLSFSANNGNSHACGHDAHTAMLLAAAKILKSIEKDLKGQVKFMFQPAEELLAGALDMINNGILENPKVDMSLALHVSVGTEESKTGVLLYKENYINYSGDAVKITVIGKGAHGSRPDLGIDAIQIASQIAVGLNYIVQKEINPTNPSVVVVGKIYGGTSVNTISDKVTMEVSIRASSNEDRLTLLEKVENFSKNIAKSYGGTVEFEHSYGMPSLYNDPKLLDEVIIYSKELLGENNVVKSSIKSGSEDFSIIAEKVPSVMLNIGAGSIDEGYKDSLHQASVILNEDMLHVGASIYAYNAMKLLENYK